MIGQALERILSRTNARKSGPGWMARCPAHDDGFPSLSIRQGDKGALLKCHAGCAPESVLDALGLTWPETFDDYTTVPSIIAPRPNLPPIGTGHVPPHRDDEREPYTIAQFSRDKGISEDILRTYGVRTGIYYDGMPCVEIPYYERDGKEYPRARLRLNGGKNGHRWNSGTAALIPYGLHRPVPYDKGLVIIPEGETDCFALWQYGFAALGLPGADSATCLRAEHFLGVSKVYVVQEPDKGGSLFPGKVAAQCYREGYVGAIFAVVLPEGIKDARAFMLDDSVRFTQRLHEAMRTAIRIEREVGTPVLSAGTQLWPEFKELLDVANPAPAMMEKLVPEPLRAWSVDTTERMNVNLEMIAIPSIVVAGSLLGRSIGIRPKRHDDGWLVVPNLWGGIVAPPATMKSSAIASAVRHLREIEACYRDEHENAMIIHEEMKADLNAAIEELQGEERRARRRELDEITRKPPVCRRISTSDTTPEKLADLLQHNPRGLLLIRDELMGWLASFNRAGHEGERQLYLEAWNGNGGYAVDRMGRGSIYIPALCVSVLGGIQPSKLAAYVREAHGEDSGNNGADGLLQRFQLLVWPDEQPDFCNVDRRSDEEARSRAFAAFDRLERLDTTQIGAMRDDYDTIPFLHFDDQAQLIFDAWREKLERRLPSKEIRSVPAFEAHLTKYRSLMPSLALIFHLLEEDVCGPVTVKAATLAIAWCDYLELHARKVYSVAERSPGRILADHIEDGKVIDGMTVRDVVRNRRSGLKSVDILKAAVAEIEPLGWCRIDEHKPPGGGRPSAVVRLRPGLGFLGGEHGG